MIPRMDPHGITESTFSIDCVFCNAYFYDQSIMDQHVKDKHPVDMRKEEERLASNTGGH